MNIFQKLDSIQDFRDVTIISILWNDDLLKLYHM